MWLGSPVIYVLDCSHAGLIVDALNDPPEPMHGTIRSDSSGLRLPGATVPASGDLKAHLPRPIVGASDPAHETIILAACGSNQLLPQDSDLCADIFTACLTTPIKVAMRWCELLLLHRTDWLVRPVIPWRAALLSTIPLQLVARIEQMLSVMHLCCSCACARACASVSTSQ
jgi:hypothetical protein